LGMVALGPSIADYFGAVADWVPDTEADPLCPPLEMCPDPP
jgi:hypothetical protein